jgi:hypothetical protein|tara:strand:- start:346 stop:1269 length:924 start_codon:yes stop_codon:yes gene_type:complete
MPIFVFGSPRSGVTLLENILGIHPELAWLSQYNNLPTERVGISYINRLYDLPMIGSLLYESAWKKKIIGTHHLPIPTEAWNFWIKFLPNFNKGVKAMESHPPSAKDMSNNEAITIQKIISKLTQSQGKDRFFATYGDFPRIDYLSKAFPDALFIHLIRDGRAVCESYFRVNQLGLYNSWAERDRWFDNMPELWRKQFYKQYHNIFCFSVYRWMYFLDLCNEESLGLPSERFLQISYEDIVKKPIKSIQRIQSFAQLSYSSKIERYIERVPPINCNRKWRQALTKEQLDDFFHIVIEQKHLNCLREDI